MILADWITGMWSAADSFFGHSAYLIVAIWLTREDTGKPGFVGFFLVLLRRLCKGLRRVLICLNPKQSLLLPPSCRCRGLTWGTEVWNGLLTGCWTGAPRSGSGQGCVCCWPQLFSLQPQICLSQGQRPPGEKFSTWITCSKTWKLIFNNTAEVRLSCVAGSGDQVLLVYTPGPCSRRKISVPGASLGPCLGVCCWRRNTVVI